ncbi:MAG TPA: hypothetical protein VE988_08880 [Gemmataceae bacterium]|nr:hypothetical protein [Gemmataceae bacterium]
MSFGQYAQEYADHLQCGSPSPIETAAAAVIVSQTQGHLAAFYCTDPHIPDYGDPEAILTGTPYNLRHWLDSMESSLREPGCHRVILAEEIGRYFSRCGIKSEVIEIDQSRERHLRREFVPFVVPSAPSARSA